ncbi:MAG: hypothetical protein ABSB97_05800 [Thermoplasmata archaeon]
MSATPGGPERAREVEKGVPLRGEPIVHPESLKGKVEVELNDLDSLIDRDASPAYPHTQPMLNSTVAKFMIDTAREDRRSSEIEVTITFRESPLRPEEEAGTRAKMSSYFANEAELAVLGQRVNRVEAWGSLRYALPVVIVAGLIAGLFANPSTIGLPSYVSTLVYLVVVVVIWVMVWDPIEKLLFDSYLIRLRVRALHKLVAAKIVFAYRPSPATPAGPVPTDPSPLESIREYLEG